MKAATHNFGDCVGFEQGAKCIRAFQVEALDE